MKNPYQSSLKGCIYVSVFLGDVFLEQVIGYLLHIEEGS